MTPDIKSVLDAVFAAIIFSLSAHLVPPNVANNLSTHAAALLSSETVTHFSCILAPVDETTLLDSEPCSGKATAELTSAALRVRWAGSEGLKWA